MSSHFDPEPFRLMDLPTELRLMIYKRLPRQIRHTKLRYVTGVSAASSSSGSTMFLVTRHVPAAILRTSRQVYAEACDIVTALIQEFVRESRPRAIGYDAGLDALARLMHLIGDECAKLATDPTYRMGSLHQRSQYFASSPWRSDSSGDVARFVHQTVVATLPNEGAWDRAIATVLMANFDTTVNQTRLIIDAQCRTARINMRNLSGEMYGGEPKCYVRLHLGGMFLQANTGSTMLTPANVPVRPDLNGMSVRRNCMLETCMSQETWVREWLPSS